MSFACLLCVCVFFFCLLFSSCRRLFKRTPSTLEQITKYYYERKNEGSKKKSTHRKTITKIKCCLDQMTTRNRPTVLPLMCCIVQRTLCQCLSRRASKHPTTPTKDARVPPPQEHKHRRRPKRQCTTQKNVNVRFWH